MARNYTDSNSVKKEKGSDKENDSYCGNNYQFQKNFMEDKMKDMIKEANNVGNRTQTQSPLD